MSKFEQIEVLLSDEKLDLLSLSETWLSPTVANNVVRINNYKIYRWDRQRNKKGGGICIYVNRKIKVDTQLNENLNVSDKDLELFVAQIKQPCTKPIILVTIYRPPKATRVNVLIRLEERYKLSRVLII